MKTDLLAQLRGGMSLRTRQLILLTVQLSLPAIMAQLSSFVMQYIDASMVGRLGAADSASIGLMASTTWLFGGLNSAMVAGFTVQVAQQIGAQRNDIARNIQKLGFGISIGLSLLLMTLAVSISGVWPAVLGGTPEILENASRYFLIYGLTLPIAQLNQIAGGMLQASGNMKVPSTLHVLMCGLDVVFNAVLIFPSLDLFGLQLPGAGLGVTGAALGTMLAQLVTALLMLYFLLLRSPMLRLRRGERFTFVPAQLKNAFRIALPIGLEHLVACGAQIFATGIVAPLGTVAIAANSFGVTAESLCYMPGYGIGAAATTIIGQSVGAERHDLTRKLGWLITGLGMLIMTVTAALMYVAAPWLMGLLSPDPEIVTLGAEVLRIEAFAEPFYAAAIVATGVFRGTGDTLVPSIFNFISMWAVRIPLAAILAPHFGLHGVWLAMCLELCVRGILFLWRLATKRKM